MWLARSVQTTTAFSIAAIRRFHFLNHLCVQWSSVFHFLQELLLPIHWLAVWGKRPGFYSERCAALPFT